MKQQNNIQQKGFTIIELMITVAILGILAAVALPAMNGYIEKRRIIGAAEEVYSQLQYARSESIKQSANMYIKFTLTGASPSATWDIGIDTTTGCDPTVGGLADCLVSGAEKVVHSTSFPNVKMTTPTFTGTEAAFESTRGTVNSGQIDLSITSYALRVVVMTLGQIRIISPDGSVTGYPTS